MARLVEYFILPEGNLLSLFFANEVPFFCLKRRV